MVLVNEYISNINEQNGGSEINSSKYNKLNFENLTKAIWWVRILLSTNSSKTTGHSHTINETRHRYHIFNKNYLKMYHKPNCEMQNSKAPTR